jgi:hypothetical protein
VKGEPRSGRSGDAPPPDVEIGARVKARKVHFEEAPRTEKVFRGHPDHEPISEDERSNLSDPVREGVTYENAEIRWRIANRLVVRGTVYEEAIGGRDVEAGQQARPGQTRRREENADSNEGETS